MTWWGVPAGMCTTSPLLAIRHEHPNHSVLPRSNEYLAVAAAAQVHIGACDRPTVSALDQFAQRHIRTLAARIAHIELNLLHRRDGARNAVVRGLDRGEIRGEQAAAWQITEYEFAAQRFDASVLGEATAYRLAVAVVVDRNRIGEFVFASPV